MNPVKPNIRTIYRNGCVVVLAAVLSISPSLAQGPTGELKISPRLLEIVQSFRSGQQIPVLITLKGHEIPESLRSSGNGLKYISANNGLHYYQILINREDLYSKLAAIPEVLFIEDASRKAVEELQVSNLDLGLNRINTVHRFHPSWNGTGVTVSIKENLPDTTDIDFKNRFLTTTLSSRTVSPHASIMASMIGGGGNTWYLGKGAAWGGTMSSSDFAILLPDANAAYQQYAITVQNHSYGVGIENYYGADAGAYDASAISNPALLHVFSSGNSGLSASATGTYSGINGMANMTGSFKMAKNIITVGATDSFNTVAAASSKGPAYDGRLKPELVAFGEDGSSGAAALVSGVSMILQQAWRQLNGSLPPNALIKAVLLNSADDTGNPGPDYSTGYGSLNALQAVRTIASGRIFNGTAGQNSVLNFPVTLPAGIRKLKLTLCWNDPPAAANAPKALVNDLDLELIHPGSGQSWKPWVLSAFPNIDSLRKPAIRKRDSLNNTEQVTLNDPAAGDYLFRVTGTLVNGTAQSFHIAYQFDSTDIFEWTFPTRSDFLFPASTNTLRWSSSFSNSTGRLEYSLNNGVNWQLLDNAVNLSRGYYRWQAPALISEILFRMTIGSNGFLTDVMTIAPRIQTGVGFNCTDSFHLYWNKLAGIPAYRVYALGDKYMAPLFTTTDSFLVLSKTRYPSLHYAVAPLVGNSEGVKSYTFNYTTQGVDCYIRSFLATLQNSTAQLQLSLGTLYQVIGITLEKYNGQSFIPIQQQNPSNTLTMNFTDGSLSKGLNSYRIRLDLSGGRSVYSSVETVYYFSGTDYILYPNPVVQNQPLYLLAAEPDPGLTLQVFNMLGQRVLQTPVNEILTQLASGKLGKGLYLFKFSRKGIPDQVMKVIVR